MYFLTKREANHILIGIAYAPALENRDRDVRWTVSWGLTILWYSISIFGQNIELKCF